MFNRQPFNRTSSAVTGVSGLATMKSSGQVTLYKQIRHSGISDIKLSNILDITRNMYHSGLSQILSGGTINATKVYPVEGDIADMIMTVSANQLVSGEALIRLENINLAPGDELVINTETMTVTLNGANATRFVADESDIDLTLLNGGNQVIYSDNAGSRTINIDIIWKDRWL